MRATLTAFTAAALLFAPAAFPQPQLSGAVATAPGKARAVSMVEASATVAAVDAKTRTVTLTLKDGRKRDIVATDEVSNFDQIKVGDRVKAKYIESLDIELKKDGRAILGRTDVGTMDRSAPGSKPGGYAIREVTAVADVVAVDAGKKTVSVKNDRGEVFDLNVRDPEQIKLVKKGDQVQATYTRALAVALEPAKK